MTPRVRDIQLLDSPGLKRLICFYLLRACHRTAYPQSGGKSSSYLGRTKYQMPEDGRLEGSVTASQPHSLEMKFECDNVGVVREKLAAAGVIFGPRSES